LERLKVASLGKTALGLALEALCLTVGEPWIASLQDLTSHCEAVVAQSALASLLEVKLVT